MKKTFILVMISSLGLLTSCAHHKDVRVGSDGVHRVVVRAETKEKGERDTLEQAKDYCKGKNKEAAIVSENSKYTGDMAEDDYLVMKKASKAAEVVGGAAHVFGGTKESNVGGVVGLGGVVADQVAGNGYTVEMTFKCI